MCLNEQNISLYFRKEKIIIILFIILILLLIYFVGFSKTRDYGKIYSIEEVYENGDISYEDLKSLAYYQNGGITNNEDVLDNNYKPQEIGSLGIFNKYQLKATLSNKLIEYYQIDITYYGTYNGYIAYTFTLPNLSVPQVVVDINIGNLNFVASNPSKLIRLYKV